MMKTITLFFLAGAATVASTLPAATLALGRTSVVIKAGETIEIPLTSDLTIASDLAATGHFAEGDVTFNAGPGCHLSARGCTLMITASPTSKRYTAVPVVVSESNATNTPVLALSVIYRGDPVPATPELPKSYRLPKRVKKEAKGRAATPTPPRAEISIQRSGNALFYAVAEPRPGFDATKMKHSRYTPDTNGPSYSVVELTNRDGAQSLAVTLTGSGASAFTFDEERAHYGANKNCASLTRIESGESCLVIVKGEVGDPRQAPQTANLTIRGESGNVASFTLRDTTFVYTAGGFNTLGNVNVSGGNLLAECTAGTCSNALQGTSGNNFSETSFSVGQWINALAITPSGNLMVGGVFGAIGGASSGASSTAALLAQCTPGPVAGNACINQLSGANSFAFNNGYINAITSPFSVSSTTVVVFAGDFSQVKSSSASSSGRMLAKATFSGTTAASASTNFIGNAATSAKSGNNAIAAIDTLGTSAGTPLVNVGGLFTQIAGFPSSAPSSGTTFANCTSGSSGTCSQGMDSNNPNSSILAMTNDGTNLYLGGAFTSIGGHIDSSGGFPLVSCVPASTTTCANALDSSNDANGYIEGLAFSGGSLFVGGRFTTIGGATPVSGGNMLATCTPGGSCSNFVTDTNPFASGTDWGGVISAVAVGTQVSILAD